MNIYDCFMYFDEDLLLDLRLNSLDKFVKKFVITEATYTHNGSKKKLNFDINKFPLEFCKRSIDSCKLPVSFMEYHTHACNPSSATSPMQSSVCATPLEPEPALCSQACVLRRSSLRLQASACRVAVSAACRVVPPCRARVWSYQTDSQRPAAGRDWQKGTFCATYAYSAGESRVTKSRVAISTHAGTHPRR